MWAWILSSVFTENRYHRDVQLAGTVLKHPSLKHCSLQGVPVLLAGLLPPPLTPMGAVALWSSEVRLNPGVGQTFPGETGEEK